MARGKKCRPIEIIPKLREAGVPMSQGKIQELVANKIGVSVQALIHWRKEYRGLWMDQAKRILSHPISHRLHCNYVVSTGVLLAMRSAYTS